MVSRSNSCIPQIVSDEPLEYTKKLFQNSMRATQNMDRVSIIDPYILPPDLNVLTQFFGGNAAVSLEIISKFNANDSDCGKIERKEKIYERKDHIVKNGLLKDIVLVHTKEPMHDRYYLYWEAETIRKVFYIGGSIAQEFGDYIGIIEVSDKFLLNNVVTYYNKLICNTMEYI